MKRLATFVILVVLSSGSALTAQTTNVSVTGRVNDPSEASIPGAKVTLTNQGTSLHVGETNDTGSYHVVRNILLGGDGGWDYVTVDSDAKRIYVPRGTHIQVVDEVTGKPIADIPDLRGLHGVEIVSEFNRGYVTGNDPDAEIYLLDPLAMKITGKITLLGAKGSDSLMYDPFSKRVFVNTAASHNAQAVDAATGKLSGSVTLSGRPEGAVPDGKGSMFVIIVDTDQLTEYDTTKLTVKNVWPTAPCLGGRGIAMDRDHRRVFLGCQPTVTSGVLVVMNADNGKVVAAIPIGPGNDGVGFDPATGDIFATCRDDGSGQNGATYVFHEDTPDKYSDVAVVKTPYGARTIALDLKTHHIFTVATEKNDPSDVTPTADNPHPRPKPVPSTFTIAEIAK